jgi:hypothetical protein
MVECLFTVHTSNTNLTALQLLSHHVANGEWQKVLKAFAQQI